MNEADYQLSLSARVDEWFVLYIARRYEETELKNNTNAEKSQGRPCRSYHVLSHIENMFKLWEEANTAMDEDIKTGSITPNSICISLSILFHDVVYDSSRSDNEEESVVWFKAFLEKEIIATLPLIIRLPNVLQKQLRWIRSIEVTVSEWVLATRHHLHIPPVFTPPLFGAMENRIHKGQLIPPLHFFLDLDLAILGCSSFNAYIRLYAKHIEKEYSFLGEEKYVSGRLHFLKKVLLPHPQWYKTPYFYYKLEKLARANVLAELEWLERRQRKLMQKKNLGLSSHLDQGKTAPAPLPPKKGTQKVKKQQRKSKKKQQQTNMKAKINRKRRRNDWSYLRRQVESATLLRTIPRTAACAYSFALLLS
eukprot:gene4692-3385_t